PLPRRLRVVVLWRVDTHHRQVADLLRQLGQAGKHDVRPRQIFLFHVRTQERLAGGPWVVRHWQPSDDSEAIAMIGSVPPVEETITEATRWMVESGLVKGAQPVGPN